MASPKSWLEMQTAPLHVLQLKCYGDKVWGADGQTLKDR